MHWELGLSAGEMLVVGVVFTLALAVCGDHKGGDYVSEYDPIEEIQHAACKIATKEIQATANATITRQLKGVCTSKELTSKLDKLERKVLKEIQGIKSLFDLHGSAVPRICAVKHVPEGAPADPKRAKKELRSREPEIARLNGTTAFNGRDKEFYYYWRISEVQKSFRTEENLTSHNFFCSGRIYYINLYPKHLNTKYVALQLRTVGFVKKPHRFVILDQDDLKYDVSSQVLNDPSNYAVLYRLSAEKVKKFVRNDTLLIKLILYV